MERTILKPLEALSRSAYPSRSVKVQIVRTLSSLLQNWSQIDWPSVFRRASQDDRLATRYGITAVRNLDACFESIDRAAALLSKLAMRLLRGTACPLQAYSAVLDAYSALSGPAAGLHTSVLPPSCMTIRLIISGSIYCTSRLFSLTQLLRRNFEVWEMAQEDLLAEGQQDLPSNSREGRLKNTEFAYYDEINREDLNKMVVVLADSVWRVKGFATVDDDPGVSVGLGR